MQRVLISVSIQRTNLSAAWKRGTILKIKSFGCAMVVDVMFQILSWILNDLNCIKKDILLLFLSCYEECLDEWLFWFQHFKLCFITFIISTHYFSSERILKGSKKNLVRFGSAFYLKKIIISHETSSFLVIHNFFLYKGWHMYIEQKLFELHRWASLSRFGHWIWITLYMRDNCKFLT